MKCKFCKSGETRREWPRILRMDKWASKIDRLMTWLGRREVCPSCGSIYNLKGDTIVAVLTLEVHAIEVED